MRLLPLLLLAIYFAACSNPAPQVPPPAGPAASVSDGWISLFDGETFDGWRVNENPETFSIRDGAIVANGERSHLFYVGPVENHSFKNFEYRVDVLTTPGSNGGLYFHTAYQDEGWPTKGYEVQVNNTSSDPRKTGSLYAVSDVHEAPAEDNTWFTEHIIVRDRTVTVIVDGDTLVTYTEPADLDRPSDMNGRVLDRGTFALQGHDPGSTVYYKNIMVRPLPD